jgi:hypothetical protein
MAVMSVAPGVSTDITLEADLTLPRIAGNREWYGIWLMLLGTGSPQRFLQVGLMRRKPDAAKGARGRDLAPFLAWTRHGEALTYLELPPLTPGVRRHRFSVGRHGFELFASMDGVTLHRERVDAVLDSGEAPTFQLSEELFGAGDRAEGTIENIILRAGVKGTMVRFKPKDFLDGRGTCLIPIPSGYKVGGRLRTGAPNIFVPTLPPARSVCP